MNLLRKITLAMVATVLLFATSCVKNEVSDEIKELRKEQLELAKANTAWKKADALARGFEADQAKYQAEKAKFQAMLEEMKIAAQKASDANSEAQYAYNKLRWEQQMEVFKTQIETEKLNLAKQKLAFDAYMADIKNSLEYKKNENLKSFYDAVNTALGLYQGKVNQLVAANTQLLNLEFKKAQAEQAYELAKAKLINVKAVNEATLNQKVKLLAEKEAEEAAEVAKLEAYKQSKDLEKVVAVEELNKDLKVKEKELADAKVAEGKAEGVKDEAVAAYNKNHLVIDIMETPAGTPVNDLEGNEIYPAAKGGLNAQLEAARKDSTDAEKTIVEKTSEVEKYKKTVADYKTELKTVLEGYATLEEDVQKAKNAADDYRNRLDVAMEGVSDKTHLSNTGYPILGIEGLYSKTDPNLGEAIEIDSTANNDNAAGILLPPNVSGENSNGWYVHQMKTAADNTNYSGQPGWVSTKNYNKITNDSEAFKALNVAYVAFKEKVDAWTGAKGELEKKETRKEWLEKQLDESVAGTVAKKLKDAEGELADKTTILEEKKQDIVTINNQIKVYSEAYTAAKAADSELDLAKKDAEAKYQLAKAEVYKKQKVKEAVEAAISTINASYDDVATAIIEQEKKVADAKLATAQAEKAKVEAQQNLDKMDYNNAIQSALNNFKTAQDSYNTQLAVIKTLEAQRDNLKAKLDIALANLEKAKS